MYDNVDDTLIAHHAFASHLPQRLDQVVSEYCSAAPWKVQHGMRDAGEKGAVIETMGGDELCLYNAQDCRLTGLAWSRMQGDLDPERAVYELDMGLAKLCHEMQWAGIGVDVGRRDELRSLCAARQEALTSELRAILRDATFAPSKLGAVRRALYDRLGAPRGKRTERWELSTDNEVLEALSGDSPLGQFCAALLAWRVVGKIASTYLDAVKVNSGTGRMHYNWKPFGTVSGRLACRLQSCPRYSVRNRKTGEDTPEGRVREIYVPRRGHTFVYFDVSQAEMRLAAFIAADPIFMKVATGSDVHAGNAAAVFPDVAAKGWLEGKAKSDPAKGKLYRDIAKNLGFAIAYGAEAQKVYTTLTSKGFPVSMTQVEGILRKLRAAYRVYYNFVDANVAEVRRVGYMRSPVLGRIRWFGRYPKPTDISNYPVQSSLADIVNLRMLRTARRIKGLRLRAELVAQVHDACIYDTHVDDAAGLEDVISEVWADGVPLKGGKLVLPIDLKRGARWSEL